MVATLSNAGAGQPAQEVLAFLINHDTDTALADRSVLVQLPPHVKRGVQGRKNKL